MFAVAGLKVAVAEVDPGVAGCAAGLMAVSAIVIEISQRSFVQRTGFPFVPNRHFGKFFLRAFQVADFGPVSDLVLAEIAGFGADGQKISVVVVTFLTFVDVGDLVGEIVRAEFNGDWLGDELKSRFGLRVVPDVGKRDPAGAGMDQETSFDQFLGGTRREGEGF